MISLEAVKFIYPGANPVFEDFNWQAQRGERWVVIGPSGCGKSTLLNLLAGLIFPTSGAVFIDGQALTRPRPRTGLMIQEYGLLPWATVRQNVSIGLEIRRFYGPDGVHAPQLGASSDKSDVEYWMKRLGINELAGRYPRQVSGGQRQRCGLARMLVLKPDLLLMDEPFSSLDAPTREGLQNLTLDLCHEQGLTLVLVTHAIEEAVLLGQKILLLGKAPNRLPVIIDNPASGRSDYRESLEYQALCRLLRTRIESTDEVAA
ncbi:MAG: ATP-binding cassette domain-containing protein [Anaerolineae bacterium]|nr:ATP-binding cassette domain-containing protein [Anaerolineae bacterium]